MGIQLSNKELDAMDGLPHFHRCLYIFGIRKHMDFATGITGIKREISYKSLAEENYVEPHQGVEESGEKSRDQVKRALKLLEKKGIISRYSVVSKNEKQLIIKCLLADRDESVQNKPAPNPPWAALSKAAPQAAPVERKLNPIKTDTKFDNSEESRPTIRQGGLEAENEKAAPHPLSVDLIRSDLRGQILNLLEQRQFSVTHLIHNKTRAMFDVLEEKKFTFEEIKEGIEHADAQLSARNERANNPWYYLSPILQKRAELEYAREKANRINEDSKDETNRPRTTTSATTTGVRTHKGYRSKDEERAEANRKLEEWAKEREQEDLEAERSGD